MSAKEKEKRPDKTQALEKYVGEIDQFAGMLRRQQQNIEKAAAAASIAKDAYEDAKAQLREAKEVEHNIVSLLLKFIRPGSVEIMPLFDQMEPADEKVHGKDADAWRKEPISALNLSASATRVLIDADIVLVGQLQDRVLKGDWYGDLGISDGVASAIELKLTEFIKERTS